MAVKEDRDRRKVAESSVWPDIDLSAAKPDEKGPGEMPGPLQRAGHLPGIRPTRIRNDAELLHHLAVQGEIKAFDLDLFRDPQPDRPIDDLEDDNDTITS